MPAGDGRLEWKPIALAGGLQDSKAIPEPGDLQDLTNWTLFRGRFALRAPLAETVRLRNTADTSDVTNILAIEYHVANCYVVAHTTVDNETLLYRLKLTGAAEDDAATETPIATIWTTTGVPRVTLTSFEGGSATDPKQRLYITDTTLINKARFWDSTGSVMANVEEDLDDSGPDDGTKENLAFPLMFEYNDHMFGTDFLQGAAPKFQLGLLRFSQPGLIPADEPGVTNNIQREWWNSDRRQVGSRGDTIIGVSDADTTKILFKRRRCYALGGFDASSWVLRLIAGGKSLGMVGPHAAAGLPDGTCLFWSDKGPQLTDGVRLIDIGAEVKRRVVAVTVDSDISVEYSPDEGLCYVIAADDGGGPFLYLAWEVNDRRWVGEGSWKATGGATLRVRDLRAISDDTLPGPVGAPTIDTVVVDSDVQLTVNWTNGDTALDTETDVHRASSAGFTPGLGNLIKTLASGIALYLDDDGVEAPQAATGALTLTANAANGETVTVDTKVYTFQTTLTDVDGNVHIKATAALTRDALVAAIILGAGSGTDYAAATTLHPTVTAASGAGDTMDATAKTPGTEGNLIATTETLASGSWGGTTLSGGAGLEPKTEYFYKLIHRRNGQSSAESNEKSATTALATPTGCTAETLSNGIRVKITNNQSGLPDLVIERRPPGGSFSTLTTLTSQTTGEKTHDDTTITCDLTYDYRVKCIDAGETDSSFSNEATATACQVPLDLTTAEHTVTLKPLADCTPSVPNVVVVWAGTNFKSGDTAKIYQNSDGGGYNLVATVPLTNRTYSDTWAFAVGSTSRSLQYRVEGWENGTVLIDTELSTLSNQNTEACEE